MNQIVKPLAFEIIPQSAPFSDAQRSWLNGFFAGFLQLDGTTTLAPASTAAAAAPAEAGRSRDAPVMATFVSRRLLNKTGSQKETWHLDFDLAETGLDYVVGDSFGVFPKNDIGLVDQVIA